MAKSARGIRVEGFQTKVIGLEDQADLQSLLVRCADYTILVDGSPPDPNAAQSLLAETPEGKSIDEKLVVGVYTPAGEMIGVLDAIRDYPAEGAWWLGLLLIAPAYRKQGLGRKVYKAFEGWIINQGCLRIFLGVIEENTRAFRFWQSVGFEEYERQPARRFGTAVHLIITMVRRFPESK